MANDDDDLLSSSNLDDFLQGDDDFMSEEQREERAANERRLARKRRLQSINQQQQQEKEETQDVKHIMTSDKKTSSTSSSVLINTNNNVDNQHGEGNKKMKSLQKDDNLLLNEDTDDLENDDDDDDDDDGFDIFSSSVSPVERDNKKTKASKQNNASGNKQSTTNTTDNVDTQQDWDDSEGYYKATIGEMIHLDLGTTSTAATTSTSSSASDGDAAHVQFRVSGVIGKGVFSTVLKAATESISPNISTDIQLPPQVAIKCIRHNETMAKAAINEIKFLQRFNKNKKQQQQRGGGKNNNTDHLNSKASKNSKQQQQNSSSSSSAAQDGIVPLLLPIDNMIPEYRGHTLLIFPYMPFNLRDVLTKFGKGVGLSLTAVRSYFGQLLAAATHLKQHNIIHCDLKPDNILVSQDFSTVRLCDFGSAVDSSGQSSFETITPYLVSRFYRAPEIILGLVPSFAIDLWSLAVTVAELFLGKVLFQGINNNDMLRVMMQHMGPFSNRVIRQHLVQTKKFPLPAHFTQEAAAFYFRQETVDPVSGQPVHKKLNLQSFSASLQSKLLKAKSAKDSRVLVLGFSDLLQKCLTLDPTRRIPVKVALQHDFFFKDTTAGSGNTTGGKKKTG